MFGSADSMGEWVQDVAERLERMEMLLLSFNFQQFTEIDEMLKSFRGCLEQEGDSSCVNTFSNSLQSEAAALNTPPKEFKPRPRNRRLCGGSESSLVVASNAENDENPNCCMQKD